MEVSKGWLQHLLSLSHGQECELRPLSVACKKKTEVGFGLSPRTRVTAGWSHQSQIQQCRALKPPAMGPGEFPLGDKG